MISTNADIGFAFDGDGDRVGLITNEGKSVIADKIIMLMAEFYLNQTKGPIVFDVKCSKLLSDEIEKLKGKPLICKTGHTYIKQKIRETDALLGGEMSGHIFFNDRWPGFDDGIYAGARMLEIIANSEQDDPFVTVPNMLSTPEINIPAADEEKFQIVKTFIENSNFSDAKIVNIDGIRVEFEKGWGLLRPSNTSPFLVLRFEAETNDDLNKIKEIFYIGLKRIKSNINKF